MPDPTTFSTQFVTTCATMLRHATHQRRTGRLLVLTVGLVLVTGRSMVSRMLLVMGMASRDWTATYRVFSAPRVAISALQRQVIAHWLRLYARHDPVVVVVDGTQLPRTGRKMPGSGGGDDPRGHHPEAWHPSCPALGRDERVDTTTAEGDSRAIPLVFAPAPSPTSRPWADHPPQTEWQAALEVSGSSGRAMDALGEQDRPLVVTGDGAYSGAGTWNALPPATTGIARCAKNRALYHLPDPNETTPTWTEALPWRPAVSHRKRRDREHSGWQTCVIRVRGKDRHLRIQVTGPWVIKKAADHPLMLITIAGIGRGRGSSRRSRDMMHFLVNARPNFTRMGAALSGGTACALGVQRWKWR
ncbi:MAG: transposase [Thermomicrobiales bacterium]|nr:transposase [Thermomicrobiales bacterium]